MFANFHHNYFLIFLCQCVLVILCFHRNKKTSLHATTHLHKNKVPTGHQHKNRLLCLETYSAKVGSPVLFFFFGFQLQQQFPKTKRENALHPHPLF